LKRLIPKAQTYVVENCGHLPQAEKPEEFVELVCR
jgi:pimeloyl-ACP methyl ester carboxylesterase